MEQKRLNLRGSEWVFIKDRVLERGQVYKNQDASLYLHVGIPATIWKEAEFIQNLNSHGFPVPKVIHIGEERGIGYYIEQTIGPKSFADKFREEYTSSKSIGSETFNGFCDITCEFLNAQLKLDNRVNTESELREGIHLNNVIKENPDFEESLLLCVDKIEHELHGLPLVITHGDYSARNIFPNGIIDFEYRFVTPVGYDVLTGVLIQHFWDFRDSAGKIQKDFDLSHNQILDYFDMIDGIAQKHGIRKLSSFLDQFLLLKAVWSLAYEKQFATKSGDKTKWNFRRSVLQYCIERYLNNQPIKTVNFRNL